MSRQISAEQFLSTAKGHWARLEAFYRHAQFIGVVTNRPDSTRVEEEVTRHAYRAHGTHMRVDSLLDSRNRNGSWDEWSRVSTPSMSFEAVRTNESDSFVLKSFSRNPTKTDSSIRWQFPFASSTYQYRNATLAEFLSNPLTQIKNCWREQTNGEERVTIECQHNGSATQGFSFSIDRAWAMVESWLGSPSKRNGGSNEGYRDRVRVVYDIFCDFPIVRRYESFREHQNGTTTNHEKVEVEDFIPSPAPLDAFELSAFGIHGTIPSKDFST